MLPSCHHTTMKAPSWSSASNSVTTENIPFLQNIVTENLIPSSLTFAWRYMGRLTELERGRYRCRFQKFSWVSLLRLSRSSSLFGRFYFMHSLRSKILHRSIKKMSKIFWKRKNIEILSENVLRFFEIFDFLKIFMIFRTFPLKNQRKFMKIMKVVKKVNNLKKSPKKSESISIFFRFQKKLMIFFIDRCKFLLRS